MTIGEKQPLDEARRTLSEEEFERLWNQIGGEKPPNADQIKAHSEYLDQAELCAAGHHDGLMWSGQIFELPGGSPHQVMVYACSVFHGPEAPREILMGPAVTPETLAYPQRVWTNDELQLALE